MRPLLQISALSLTFVSAFANDRPTIGILSLPNDLPPSLSTYTSYFPASYARWVEAGGARAVPILYDGPASQTRVLLASLNGAVLTGGGAAFFDAKGALTQYAATAQLIVNEALAAAAADETWPVWGTCLGHELMLVLASGPNSSVLSGPFDAEDLMLPLVGAPAAKSSRLWGGAPADTWAWLTSENITANFHTQGVTPEDFAGSTLARDFDVLSTNVDRAGRAFVSSTEHKSAPLYTSQFHPEKPAYEMYINYSIPHTDHAIHANGWTARFFVNESRKNIRAFPSAADEAAALLYNTAPIFTGGSQDPALARWESIYAFWGGFTAGRRGSHA